LHTRNELDVSVNLRETNVGPLKSGDHRVHHALLPRPIVSLECCATVHVHWYTALANQYGALAKRAVTSLHESADLRGEIVTCSLMSPVKGPQWIHTLLVARQNDMAETRSKTRRTREIA